MTKDAEKASSQAPPPTASQPADFEPSKKFQGARAGCHFTLGPRGLGYYNEAQVCP